MKTTARTRLTAALGAAALSAVALTPVAFAATAASADEPGSACEATGGELTWGVKESFRSYISGTIANGEWQTSDGASYETPEFAFGEANGGIDATTGEGSVSFAGTVLFTGHDGVLNLILANPTIEFVGDGSARLLLDTKSNNAQGELVVDEEQVAVGKIDAVGDVDPSNGSLEVDAAPVVLTAEGAEAFSGFYATGESLDPVSLSVQLGPCASEAGDTPTEAPEESVAEQPVAEESGTPWLPIAIGAVAIAVIGVTAGMLIAGRRKGAPAPEEPTDAPTE